MIDPERADAQLAGEMLGWIVAGLQSAARPSRGGSQTRARIRRSQP
jgi:hypothetical protein